MGEVANRVARLEEELAQARRDLKDAEAAIRIFYATGYSYMRGSAMRERGLAQWVIDMCLDMRGAYADRPRTRQPLIVDKNGDVRSKDLK